ncbi:unnamed protein product [Orchesella dallaii]|uniref:C2H2-type domain-containing protein n=1 Tax=Orchesella dallaii TaxID=48710 RepID=A0ABP1RHI0_9HEXA
MAREIVDKRTYTCFMCLKTSDLDFKVELSSTSQVPDLAQFTRFTSTYLKLPVPQVYSHKDRNGRRSCEEFCEPCGIRVKRILDLYSELCEVELRFSSKLEELGKLIQDSDGNYTSQEFLGIEVEEFRKLVSTKCFEKHEEVQTQRAMFHGWNSSLSPSNGELEEDKEIKVEMEDSNDEDERDNPLSNSQEHYYSNRKSIGSPLQNPIAGYDDDDEMDMHDEFEDVPIKSEARLTEDDEFMSISRKEKESDHNSCSKGNFLESSESDGTSNASDSSEYEVSEESNTEDDEEPVRRRNPCRFIKRTPPPAFQVTSVNEFGKHYNKRLNVTHSKRGLQTFKCQQCGKYKPTESRLYTHVLYHDRASKKNGKSCSFCSNSFVFDQTHQLHTKLRHKSNSANEKPFICDENECDESFTSVSELNTHLKHHTSQKSYICSLCGWGFIYEDNLKLHELLHTPRTKGGSFPCPCCSLVSKGTAKLQTHYKLKHLGKHSGKSSLPHDFLCHHCGKYYSSDLSLFFHLRKHEEKSLEPISSCCFCNKSFIFEQTHQIHRKLYHKSIFGKENPVKCDGKGCDDSFTSTAELNEHLKVHCTSENQSIHHCSGCDWGFINEYQLKLHELLHIAKSPKGYPCPCCPSCLHTGKELQMHYNRKHGSNLGGFKCPKCHLILAMESAFEKHMKKHQDTKDADIADGVIEVGRCVAPPPCSECGLQFLHSKYLDKHRKEAHNLGIQCPFCPKLFTLRNALSRHIHKFHKPENSETKFPCPHCPSICGSRSTLNDHIAIQHPTLHDGKGKHQCPHCEARFHRNLGLWKHLSKCEKNPEPTMFTKINKYIRKNVKVVKESEEGCVCHLCGKLLKNTATLQIHQKTVHIGEKYGCHLCPMEFTAKASVKGHLRTVHGKVKGQEFSPGEGEKAKRNICLYPSCGEIFATNTELQSHVAEKHSTSGEVGDQGDIEFMCKLCGKVFANQARLTRHNLVHTNEKLFKCPVCKKGFAYRSSLKEHEISVHRDVNKELPYFYCKQPNCDAKFDGPAKMYSHLRRVHGVYTAKSRKVANTTANVQ